MVDDEIHKMFIGMETLAKSNHSNETSMINMAAVFSGAANMTDRGTQVSTNAIPLVPSVENAY